MANEPTPTPTSTPASDAPAPDAPAVDAPAPADTPAKDAPAPKDAPDDLGSTALGNGEDAPAGDEAAPAAPETYELTAPEGFAGLDADSLAAATPVFQELGLTNDQANKLMPVAGEFAKKIIAERDQQFLSTIATQRKEWLDTAQADPEIGGKNWDASLSGAAKALDTLGFPKGSPLRGLLDDSGLGNHPEMIRAWAKVGKAIGEDSDFVRSEHNAPVKKTDAELFYGSNK